MALDLASALAGGTRHLLQTSNATVVPLIDITRGGELDSTLTSIWLLVTGFLVFFMQVMRALLLSTR